MTTVVTEACVEGAQHRWPSVLASPTSIADGLVGAGGREPGCARADQIGDGFGAHLGRGVRRSLEEPVHLRDVGATGARPGHNGSGPTTSAISLALSRGRARALGRALVRRRHADATRSTPRGPAGRCPPAFVLWWISLLANRVSPPHSCMNSTSTPSTPDSSSAASATGANPSAPEQLGHQRTPTWTLRNRAGEAPCPTRPTCPGWPLPQLGVPHTTQSSRPPTASHEPQNSGASPV